MNCLSRLVSSLSATPICTDLFAVTQIHLFGKYHRSHRGKSFFMLPHLM